MKNLVKSKLFGGVVLCLTMLFASCGNADNALEEIINGGGNTSPLATPLTLEATSAGTIVVNKPQNGMQYSLNGGAKTTLTADPTNITVAAGDKLAFYGKGTTITAYCSNGSDNTNIQGSGTGFTFKVYGNIMSLIDETGFATATTLSARWAFTGLFSDNVYLTDASGLQLPATTLAKNSYHRMFKGCSNLTSAPSKLPATTVTESCYARMFEGCKSLTTAPELPATTLDSYCYSSMFRECKSLTTAPALPATTLAGLCYQGMFNGCTNLTTAPALPATTLANQCYYSMFEGCTSLTTTPALKAETLVMECYRQMFRGCTNLTAVTCLATDISATDCTTSWLDGVAATGTFYRSTSVDDSFWSGKIPGTWSIEVAP